MGKIREGRNNDKDKGGNAQNKIHELKIKTKDYKPAIKKTLYVH